ncbi:MAG: two-component sensor histidine kinase, partial [Winogradskyella sp.]|nr:two-component sensor histidine kinase [Winogradskyella sp.]
MRITKLSLRSRIFIAMILLVLLASVLIAAVTIYQYNEEARDYHKERLERKERAIKKSIDNTIQKTTYPVATENIPLIFKDAIFEIDAIHNLQINLYDLEGELLKSSKRTILRDTTEQCLDAEVLNTLSNTVEHRYVKKIEENGQTFQSSYSYITDEKFKNLAILNLPYLENDDFLNKELNE